MNLEAAANHFRREAAECKMNAEKTNNLSDRRAWENLARNWTKLAFAADANPHGKGRKTRRPPSQPAQRLMRVQIADDLRRASTPVLP